MVYNKVCSSFARNDCFVSKLLDILEPCKQDIQLKNVWASRAIHYTISKKEAFLMACENLAQNKKRCSCDSTYCARHGVCCECVRYHRENGGRPACLN